MHYFILLLTFKSKVKSCILCDEPFTILVVSPFDYQLFIFYSFCGLETWLWFSGLYSRN